MKPVEFPEQNMVFMKDGCNNLPAFTDKTCIISCWELDESDIEVILSTRKIYLTIVGGIQPPVALQVDIPISSPMDFPDVIGDTEET